MDNIPVRILLVDDEEELLKPLKKTLELKGCSVVTTTGGHLAWILFNKLEFDVVLTDINMSAGDGVTLIKNIKGKDINFPILCFLTDTSVLSVEAMYKLGVEAILAKPFHFSELCERILWISKSRGQKFDKNVSYSEDLICIHGSGDVEHGRGGMSFSYKPQKLPPIGELCRFHIPVGEAELYSGVGWLRWANSSQCRLGLEVMNLEKGFELREKCKGGNDFLSYIP